MEFNRLTTLEKLRIVLGNFYDCDYSTVYLIASAIDQSDLIELVEFLSEKDRAHGCKWCGG